ncbi:hypothetical protein Dimus_024147, partial [Dionaea muscipula]
EIIVARDSKLDIRRMVWRWRGRELSGYSVGMAYQMLCGRHDYRPWWSLVWNTVVPPRA